MKRLPKELDELVAEHVMGWHQYGRVWFDKDNLFMKSVKIFTPSTDIACARLVMQKLQKEETLITIKLGPAPEARVGLRQLITPFPDDCVEVEVVSDNLCSAICKAALKLKGVDV